ncbi:uncharacterized protein [Anabrus simplex]|uniref:uncharacterized protein n=2 Tax=Anabrus simplex TaxID=316456 RepID=UPI0035A2F36B
MISIEQYRATVGGWQGRMKKEEMKLGRCYIDLERKGELLLSAAVILILLCIGGVELNPGPTPSRKEERENMDAFKRAVKEVVEEVGPFEQIKNMIKEQTREFERMEVWLREKTEGITVQVRHNTGEVAALREEIGRIEKENLKLKIEVEANTLHRRKKCLFIYGVPEELREDKVLTTYKVVDLIQGKLKLNFSEVDIDDVQRVGKIRGKRPIKLELFSTLMADAVVRSASNMQREKIWIKRDVGWETIRNEKILRKHKIRAINQGLRATIKGQELVVAGRNWKKIWTVNGLIDLDRRIKEDEEKVSSATKGRKVRSDISISMDLEMKAKRAEEEGSSAASSGENRQNTRSNSVSVIIGSSSEKCQERQSEVLSGSTNNGKERAVDGQCRREAEEQRGNEGKENEQQEAERAGCSGVVRQDQGIKVSPKLTYEYLAQNLSLSIGRDRRYTDNMMRARLKVVKNNNIVSK